MPAAAAGQTWNPEAYARNAAFVPALGLPVLDLLAAKPGERILDLGCGNGTLTRDIASSGAVVLGADSSPQFVEAARQAGIDAVEMDGQSLRFAGEFDAVVSNAALHWMRDADAVVEGVARALRPGGRFVAEMGAHGNVAAIVVALTAAADELGIDGAALNPWYFPTVDAYARRLRRFGFVVDSIALIPRPTPLPTGLEGWIDTFAGPFVAAIPATERSRYTRRVTGLAAPALRDEDGNWTADYVRLRFAARLADG